jgi:hypothetical protein
MDDGVSEEGGISEVPAVYTAEDDRKLMSVSTLYLHSIIFNTLLYC